MAVKGWFSAKHVEIKVGDGEWVDLGSYEGYVEGNKVVWHKPLSDDIKGMIEKLTYPDESEDE
jgi:hypothetical protein